jgi:hypothetical protein
MAFLMEIGGIDTPLLAVLVLVAGVVYVWGPPLLVAHIWEF